MTDLTAARLLCEKMTAGDWEAILPPKDHPMHGNGFIRAPDVVIENDCGPNYATVILADGEYPTKDADLKGIVLAVSLLRALCDEGAVERLGKVLEPYLYAEGLGKNVANLIITSIFDAAGRDGK